MPAAMIKKKTPNQRRRASAGLTGMEQTITARFFFQRQLQPALAAHLDTPTKVRRERASVAELESSANPQPGKAALRSARFPACGFWRLSSRQMVVLSRCAQEKARPLVGNRNLIRESTRLESRMAR